ncbi:MAG: hypothetical protein U1E70_11410 [Acetobacteraceae bacterium]
MLIAGYVAAIPWLVLHLLANRDLVATMPGYYALPFLAACAWPIAGTVIDARRRGARANPRRTMLWFSLLLAVSFLGVSTLWNPGALNLADMLARLPSLARQRATNNAVELVITASESPRASPFGVIAVDQAVYSLALCSFGADGMIASLSRNGITPVAPVRPFDTVAYFHNGFDAEIGRRFAKSAGL